MEFAEIIELAGAVLATLGLLALLIFGAVQFVRSRKLTGEEQQKALDQLVALKSLLSPMLLQMVTTAEQAWGGGTGTFKFGDVLGRATKMLANYLPESIRALIPPDKVAEALSGWIEEALEVAKGKWGELEKKAAGTE